MAFRNASINLRGEAGQVVPHTASNGSFFTVRELLQAIEETERLTRAESQWLGGIDHVLFEGIYPEVEGVWRICWGSGGSHHFRAHLLGGVRRFSSSTATEDKSTSLPLPSSTCPR